MFMRIKVIYCLASIFIFHFAVYNNSFVNCEQKEHDDHGKHSSLVLVKTEDTEAQNEEDNDGIVVTAEEDHTVNHQDKDVIEKFVPTEEWQEVKEGQPIPAGLHVQMDFQTGKKRAKLMAGSAQASQQKTPQRKAADRPKLTPKKPTRKEPSYRKNRRGKWRRPAERTGKTQSWDGGDKIGVINTEKKRYTREELKKALKDFKYKDIDSPSKKDESKKTFRNYDELKDIMKDRKMAVKTENEIVTELYTNLQKTESEVVQVTLLTDLEYYLHQVDNAKVFTDQGGLKTLTHLLNSSHSEVRSGAAHALGAAMQSNGYVQVAALDVGVMQTLVTTLSVDSSLPVRKKSLFALSTLVRQFPYAQKRFLDVGGLSALAGLFSAATDDQLKIKIITLLTDLLVEYDYNIKQTDGDAVQIERTVQYKKISLRESMSSSGWCGLMSHLLTQLSGHDSVEKLITAMTAVASTCRHDFHPFTPQLQLLLSQYQQLAQDEAQEGGGHDDFFSSIHTSIQSLVAQIVRDEL